MANVPEIIPAEDLGPRGARDTHDYVAHLSIVRARVGDAARDGGAFCASDEP